MNECVNKDFFLVSNLAVVSIKIERGLGFICLTYYQLLSRDRLVVVGELALPFSVDDKEDDGDDGDEGDDDEHHRPPAKGTAGRAAAVVLTEGGVALLGQV